MACAAVASLRPQRVRRRQGARIKAVEVMAARWNLLVVPVEGDTVNGGNAHEIKVESDEHGFELHIDSDEGGYVFNIHGVADDLYKAVTSKIGPWRAEGEAVKAEFDRRMAAYDDEDNGPWPGESALAFWKRTGSEDAREMIFDQADLANKARKEN